MKTCLHSFSHLVKPTRQTVHFCMDGMQLCALHFALCTGQSVCTSTSHCANQRPPPTATDCRLGLGQGQARAWLVLGRALFRAFGVLRATHYARWTLLMALGACAWRAPCAVGNRWPLAVDRWTPADRARPEPPQKQKKWRVLSFAFCRACTCTGTYVCSKLVCMYEYV